MQMALLALVTTILLTKLSSAAEYTTTSSSATDTPTTDGTVELREPAKCEKVRNINIDCDIPLTNEQPTVKQDTTDQHDNPEITLLCAESENDTELCDDTDATSRNDVNYKDSSAEDVTTALPCTNDLQAEETFQAFSVDVPPSEIIINLENADRRPPKPKITQALFSLNNAQRFTAIRKPTPIQKPGSTQVEVMKSIEIPFDSSQFQIYSSADELPLPASTNQVLVVQEPKRLGHMENILHRRERYEFNRQDQRRYLSDNFPSTGPHAGPVKEVSDGNNALTPQNEAPYYFDFNSRMLLGNNMVRQQYEDTVFGEKNTKPAETLAGQGSPTDENSESYVNVEEIPVTKSPTTLTNVPEINNTSTFPMNPTRSHRRRNKNNIYNPSNTRNFYRSKFRKNIADPESSPRDDTTHEHKASSPSQASASTTTEIYARYKTRERGSSVRKPYADEGARNGGVLQEATSTARTFPTRSQRRRTSTTTETPSRRHTTPSSDLYTETEPSIPPTRPSRVHQSVREETCLECPDVQSQQEVPPSRRQQQRQHETTEVTSPRPRGMRKFNPNQELTQTLPESTSDYVQARKKPRTQDQHREKQLQRQKFQQQHLRERQQQVHQDVNQEKDHRDQQEHQQSQLEGLHQKLQQPVREKQQLQDYQRDHQEDHQKSQLEGLHQRRQQERQQPVQERQQQQDYQSDHQKSHQEGHHQRRQQERQQPERERQQQHQEYQRSQQQDHQQLKQEGHQRGRQQEQQLWTQPYNSQPQGGEHNLEVFTRVHPPKVEAVIDVFPRTHLEKSGRTNRGHLQYHDSADSGHFLHVFHPAAGSTSFTHHGSIPTVDQTGQVEDILLVSYHHDNEAPIPDFKPIRQQQVGDFFF